MPIWRVVICSFEGTMHWPQLSCQSNDGLHNVRVDQEHLLDQVVGWSLDSAKILNRCVEYPRYYAFPEDFNVYISI